MKMTRMRVRIAQRLKESQNSTAMLTTFQECDMSSVFEMREKYKDAFEKKHSVKLGFMSAFVKAAASSLQEFPIVNAVIDGGDIVYRDYVDISVAVSSPRGLVVPVIRNAEGLNFAGIERTLGDLALKARNDQIAIEDMAGGTFTIKKDDESPRIKRGSRIVLYLKEDQLEYLEEKAVKDLVKKHSEFINFPIYLQVDKTKELEVPEDEEEDSE